MGWAGNGGPHCVDCLRTGSLPIVTDVAIPLFTIWFSRDGEESDRIDVVVGRRKTIWAFAPRAKIFLPLVALIYLLANPVVQDVLPISGQSVNRHITIYTLKITPSRSTIAWKYDNYLYQDSRLAASRRLETSYLGD